jgi:glycerophosphoryl diester phosphodiesterase
VSIVALRFAAFAALLFMAGTHNAHSLDLQGHRGARGLAPENTLRAFATALSIGVTTLELDTGVTRDGVVVISHDRALNPDLSRGPDGLWLRAPGPAIHSLTLEELRRFDVGVARPGSKYAQRYPRQVAAPGAHIPTLAELFELTARAGNGVVRFNIETKLSPLEPAETLAPAAFADALLGVIRDAGMSSRVSIQSFDWRTLQHVQAVQPEIETVYLSAQQQWLDNIEQGRPGVSPWTAGLDVDDYAGSVPAMIAAAGGKVWSPYHQEIDAARLAEAHDLGLRVVVWTVNDAPRMRELIGMGVDGIISDYPDLLRQVMLASGLAIPAPTPL